ncbi:MAG: hypothetical protein HQ512_07780 [Rhodospirillales bacterium]|nr:hypothetical protein [Rhodospirillales bacterium]
MTDNLLETSQGDHEGDPAPAETLETEVPDTGTQPSPPDGLPEKFWDQDRGELRTESLIKSYQALEQKLGALSGQGVPEDPNGYDIKVEDELFTSDPDINAKLHSAGFSQEQAQTVYDLASEHMLPMVSEVAAEFHAQAQIDRLAQKFGGEDKWRETAAQLKSWGQANYPDEVFRALSSTYEGVLTMQKMMGSNEPGLIDGAGAATESVSEKGLQQMMQDPRYWRDHDPAIVARVRDGFKRLFPD